MVSIIMPVYNTADYLKKTIENIINQTYKDWELICVDDESSDDSLKIIKQFEAYDNRIHLISQAHQGAGVARNNGFEISRGEYVIFLDSDDSFSINLLDVLYKNAIQTNADVVMCGCTIENNGLIKKVERPKSIPNGIFDISELDDSGFAQCGYFSWNKLVKRKLIVEYNILFQNLQSSNDVFFSCMVIYTAKRLLFVDESNLIIYKKGRDGNISSRRNPVNCYRAAEAIINRIPTDDENGIRKALYVMLVGGIYELRRTDNEELIKHFCEEIKQFVIENKLFSVNASDIQKYVASLYVNNSVQTKWWKENVIFKYELEANKEKILNELNEYKRFVLWGCGKRGKALLCFFLDNDIAIYGITDKDKSRAEQLKSELGLDTNVLDIDNIDEQTDLIIACNTELYSYLKRKNLAVDILDIERYCPLA
ncbi:glycosyltransferase family 2 protein [Butyrivibrio sp. M55]|uniref:glycosyltransferase family 2 protein n=1 Tax=Butyrivibrio sp. M55 TaxID=1855323 RepID=UPI0008E34F4A|nr:glycosyltransferase family 2 protein [Butyrivibrio sp. M55]SFU66057.1 Glycosyltransferase involved in cell wall bisynthesis [Butyrivibrio sp. M55]